jgi:hypothetical protein
MHRKLLVLSITALCVLPGFAHDTREAATTAPATAAISSPAGMIVHIDPTTGAILDHPATGATKLDVPAELAERWSTSSEGLIEQPNPSGGKGMYMNLQGRFENGTVATITTDGKLSVPCAQGLNTAANLATSEK